MNTHIIKYFSKVACIILCISYNSQAFAQTNNKIDLPTCIKLAHQNYPASKQLDLIRKTAEFSLSNASKLYLPNLSIGGQASYQSDVTNLPISIPGVSVPSLSKDQYKIYGEFHQAITDIHTINIQKEQIKNQSQIQSQTLEVELYKLNTKITELYFGILLINEQLIQTKLLQQDIQTGIDRVKVSIANGIALQSSADILRAEQIKVEQRIIELETNKSGYIQILKRFINSDINEQTIFLNPSPLIPITEIHRPELKLYESKNAGIEIQNKLTNTKTIPRVSLFLQTGYGRPAMNMLSNSFDYYYIGGLRLSWNISNYYTAHNEKEILQIQKNINTVQKETFILSTQIELEQQNTEIVKLQKLIETDEQIISLRSSIASKAKIQLENGTITANDYVSYVNAHDQAKQKKLLHKKQLELAIWKYNITSGN
ncbi:MAG: TolC family protein [Bacteroidales bacterium]|jgi:outer membrane protein TolC|nr:TolC family protein [Bacteroidales bacterium]